MKPATINYQPLPTNLRKGGFDLQQLARAGDWAVYQQSIGGRVCCYELVFAKKSPACTLGGRDYPAREVYPGNENWGSLAWSVVDRDEALRRMEKLAGAQAAATPSPSRDDSKPKGG